MDQGTQDDTSAVADLRDRDPLHGVMAVIELGEPVEVRRRFDRAWARGFEVAAAAQDGYRLRRTSDGAVLPVAFPAADVRRSGSMPVDQGRRS